MGAHLARVKAYILRFESLFRNFGGDVKRRESALLDATKGAMARIGGAHPCLCRSTNRSIHQAGVAILRRGKSVADGRLGADLEAVDALGLSHVYADGAAGASMLNVRLSTIVGIFTWQ